MYSKEQQLKKNRIKPKPNMKNKPKITQHEKGYLEWLQQQSYPCFVCGTYRGIEYHHIKNKSTDKKQHNRLIPLCFNHHRVSNKLSAHGTPKKWRETYSMMEQLEYAKKIYEEYLNA